MGLDCAVEFLTRRVLFMPSGVISYAQASTTATGNPSTNTTMTNVTAQAGSKVAVGKTMPATRISSEATTT